MPFEKEKAAIRGMVVAGNYGWAILALMELLEVTELHCREQGLRVKREDFNDLKRGLIVVSVAAIVLVAVLLWGS